MNHQLRAVNTFHRKVHLNRQFFGFPGSDGTATTGATAAGASESTSAHQATQTSAAETKTAGTPAPTSAATSAATAASQADTNTPTSTGAAASKSSAATPSDTSSSSSTSAASSSSSSSTKPTSSSSSTSSSSHSTSQPTAAATSAAAATSKANRPVASASVEYTYVSAPAKSTSAAASSSATVDPSNSTGGASTSTLVGAIGGAIVGIAVVSILVAFFIRKFRKRRSDEDHFSASQFRRSAVLLDDEFNPSAPSFRSVRPPTMIERHVAHTPTFPNPAYGNYGSTDQYSQYNQYPVYGEAQQYSFAPGEIVNPATPGPEYQAEAYANPIGHAHSGSAGSAEAMHDPNVYLNRQPTVHSVAEQTGPGIAEQHYVDMDRVASPPAAITHDSVPVVAAPDVTAQVQHAPIVSAVPESHTPTAPAAAPGVKRPDTVYDPEDAYGGM